MLFTRNRSNSAKPAEVDLARLAALENAQRRDPYVAGRGDGPPRRRRGLRLRDHG